MHGLISTEIPLLAHWHRKPASFPGNCINNDDKRDAKSNIPFNFASARLIKYASIRFNCASAIFPAKCSMLHCCYWSNPELVRKKEGIFRHLTVACP